MSSPHASRRQSSGGIGKTAKLDDEIRATKKEIRSLEKRVARSDPCYREWNDTHVDKDSDWANISEFIRLGEVVRERSRDFDRLNDLRMRYIALMKKRHPRAFDPRYKKNVVLAKRVMLTSFFVLFFCVIAAFVAILASAVSPSQFPTSTETAEAWRTFLSRTGSRTADATTFLTDATKDAAKRIQGSLFSEHVLDDAM